MGKIFPAFEAEEQFPPRQLILVQGATNSWCPIYFKAVNTGSMKGWLPILSSAALYIMSFRFIKQIIQHSSYVSYTKKINLYCNLEEEIFKYYTSKCI